MDRPGADGLGADGPMTQLQAIFFDIDNTLFATRTFVAGARRAAITAMCEAGLRGDIDHLLEQLAEVVAEFGSNDSGHFAKLLKRLPPESLGGRDPLILEAAGIVGYQQTKFRKYKPHEDVLEVLGELARSRLILGILSNGRAIKQAEKLVRLGVLPYLDSEAIFISEAQGVAKPNPRAFMAPCQKFDLEPESVMIVGDHPEMDVEPTRKLGMISVQNCRNIETARRHPGADYHINNFWDLQDILREDFRFD